MYLAARAPCVRSSGSRADGARARQVPWDAARVYSDDIAWISRDSSKPGRASDGGECWVALSTTAYARDAIVRLAPIRPSRP